MNGKAADISITKVGGEEEQMRTKLYKIPLLISLETHIVYNIAAIGIPSICDNVSAINIGEISQELSLQEGNIFRGYGPIDILIGTNYAKMHTNETKEAANFIARRSPLGLERKGEVNKVLHVQLSSPVDFVLPDNRSNGVNAKSNLTRKIEAQLNCMKRR